MNPAKVFSSSCLSVQSSLKKEVWSFPFSLNSRGCMEEPQKEKYQEQEAGRIWFVPINLYSSKLESPKGI